MLSKLLSIFFSVVLIIPFLPGITPSSYSDNTTSVLQKDIFTGSPLRNDLNLYGQWKVKKGSIYPIRTESALPESVEVKKISSRFFHARKDIIPGNTKFSYGGMLNFKYFTGISYDYLQKNLPGKTVSVDIHIPGRSISPSDIVPNKLKVCLKAEDKGKWTGYSGGKEWINVKEKGTYRVKITIPAGPVKNLRGETFYPDKTALFSIEYFLPEGNKYSGSSSFSFSGFNVEGLEINENSLKWQASENGYALENDFLRTSGSGSTIIGSMGKGLDLRLRPENIEAVRTAIDTGMLHSYFITMKIFIPEQLQYRKGTLGLTLKDHDGNIRSTVRNFDAADLGGAVFLTLSLEGIMPADPENMKKWTFDLKIRTDAAHTSEMPPITISPIRIIPGRLLPFDSKWKIRTPGKPPVYNKIPVKPENKKGVKDVFTAKALGAELYQMDANVKLKGGINWNCPYYRVEIARLTDAPVSLDNMHLEVTISPITDLSRFWQVPFRARIGVIDEKEKVMFGPNISLCEGRPNKAWLDISMTNPIPKGFVMPGFDPSRIKGIVINIESSHEKTGIMDIPLSFTNCYISPKEYPRTNYIEKIDFSSLETHPSSWILTKMINKNASPLIGINYPFPVIKDLPPGIMEIPQIYPCVGKKTNDKVHLGFSSEITGKTLFEDFSLFAEKDIKIVRMLILGHLEGVFTWAERGKMISGFDPELDKMIQKAAGLPVEKLAAFIRENENILFQAGNIPGLEEHVLPDLFALLDTHEKVSEKTGKKIISILSLLDFTMGDGITAEGPYKKYTVGEHTEVVTDPITKTKAHMILWKLMNVFSHDPRFKEYIGAIEIMNEPGNASALSTKKLFPDLLNYMGETLYLVKDAIGPEVPVTIGFRSWPPDLRYWSPLAKGLDILLPHYWYSLESYDINVPELWPMDMPAKKLWEYMGVDPKNRITGIGEISPGGDVKKNLINLEKAGYDLILLWSYSGHDGHDAKLSLPESMDYSKANMIADKLSRDSSPAYFKKAFTYISAAKRLFESEGKHKKTTTGREPGFNDYLSDKANNISDKTLRDTVSGMQKIIKLKDMSYAPNDMDYLERQLSDLAKKNAE